MKPYFVILSVALTLLAGCKKFLDVQPIDKVFEEELFESRDGFENALADVYYQMSQPSLYGRELTYGTLDAIAGYWNIPSQQHIYSTIMPLDFKVAQYQSTLGNYWSGLYGCINRVNHIIKNIDKLKGEEYYDIVYGEALGLRAFLHLELLKLFGPVIKVEGDGAKAIPYYKEIKNTPQPFLTARQVFDNIENDLNAAEIALENDPIRTLGRTGDGNGTDALKYNSLIDRRGDRMNYFAVLALKARKSLWEGKMDQAYERANKLMTGLPSGMRLINSSDIASSYAKNKRFTVEGLFNLYIRNHRDMTLNYLPPLSVTSVPVSPTLLPQYTTLLNTLYNNPAHGSVNDYRLLNWFATTATSQWRFTRLEIDPDNTTFSDQYEVPLITLAEMYLIMAEAKASSDPQSAYEILNRLRLTRNLTTPLVYDPATMSSEDLLASVVDESRKNFMGNGYVFLMFKRMFRPIIRPTGTTQPTLDNMKFPVPIDEQTYNNTK